MAPRPYWKGFLRLSLVSCPIVLYPATTEAEKVHFHQINSKTGHRVRYRKVDEDSGDEVEADDIVKGFEVAKGKYLEITDEDLEAVELESTRAIDIDEFVPREEIDDLYNIRPYYIAPDGKAAVEAFITIREAIAATEMVAIGRLVLTSREHMIAINPRGRGMVGTLLRYPYEVREESEYFDEIPDKKIDKEMLDLAKHIVSTKRGHFKPDKFEDRYEEAVKSLIKRKAKGEKIEVPKEERPSNVISLMDALKRSVAQDGGGGSSKKKASSARRKRKAPARKKSSKAAAATRKAS
jgi:DNA end-binding protein Ku